MAAVTSQNPNSEPGLARGLTYPAISLEAALRRAKAIPEASGTRLVDAARVWGYRPKSSGIALTASALKQFSLFFDIGHGDDRVLRPTRLLLDIIRGQDVEANIKRAALAPRVLRERFARWGFSRRLNDDLSLADLKATYGYNDAAARTILRVFDDTVSFARLSEQDHAKVLAEIPEGARHYIRETETGRYQVTAGDAELRVIAPAVGRATGSSGLTFDALMLNGVAVAWPTKRFTYQTDQGTVVLDLPSRLSEKSVANLIDWFWTLLKQARAGDAGKPVADELPPDAPKGGSDSG